MASPGFIHLNCHSAYSLLEGALPLATLVKLAAADGMPAVGVTDTANLFGALEFSEKAARRRHPADHRLQAAGPLRGGAGVRGRAGPDRTGARATSRRSFCSPRPRTAIAALIKLVTDFYLGEAGRAEPVPLDALAAASAGLIALTGGHDGPLYPLARGGRVGARRNAARGAARRIFGDRLYVGARAARHGGRARRPRPASSTSPTASICRSSRPTSRSSRRAEDFEAHDALLAIAEGRLLSTDDRRRLTPEHHFASRAEMMRRFADLPEALENTVEIALRCRTRPHVVQPILPRFVADRRPGGGRARGGARSFAARRKRGSTRRLAAQGCAPGLRARRTTASASTSSSASSRR